jgi:hypothetical protein
MNGEDFEARIYQQLGIPDRRDETHVHLQALGTILYETGRIERNWDLLVEGRELIWRKAPDELQVALIMGRVATLPSRPFARARSPLADSLVLPKNPREFATLSKTVGKIGLAGRSVAALNRTMAEAYEFVPSYLLGWSVEVLRHSDKDHMYDIADSLHSLGFHDKRTDSADMTDPHPIAPYVFDETLPESFREMLLEVAERHAKTTEYKPHVWLSQLETTWRDVAHSNNSALRASARERLGAPIDDDEFAASLERERALRLGQRQQQEEARATQLEVARRLQVQRISDYLINY